MTKRKAIKIIVVAAVIGFIIGIVISLIATMPK